MTITRSLKHLKTTVPSSVAYTFLLSFDFETLRILTMIEPLHKDMIITPPSTTSTLPKVIPSARRTAQSAGPMTRISPSET